MQESLVILDNEFRTLTTSLGVNMPIPPPCFTAMKGKFVEYESRKFLKVAFPVLPDSLNPYGTMQGGFITAAFDNAFGPLSYLSARTICTTIDLHTQYVRGIEAGDTLTVSVMVVSRGPDTLHMSGEAYNARNKLVATGTTNLLILHNRK